MLFMILRVHRYKRPLASSGEKAANPTGSSKSKGELIVCVTVITNNATCITAAKAIKMIKKTRANSLREKVL